MGRSYAARPKARKVRKVSYPPTSTSKRIDYHFLWGVAFILFGLLVGYFWLWGNAIQIQTSEAWIIGSKDGLSIAPRLDIFFQLTKFGSGSLTPRESIAYTWGWLNQIILFAFSIGIEFHIGGKARVTAWRWASGLFIVLNSLADLSYGNAFGGAWQPWVFAGVCFMASFFFGVVAIGLIVEGFKRIFHIGTTK
ncbi:MAG: hypothetical protein ACRDHW_02410 [Ktedonobacteraceae bacterium]